MKKTVLGKSLALLLALVMVLSCMSAVAFAAELKGSGTEADPYIIGNAAQLSALSELPEVGYVSLADDIDMSGIEPQTSFIKKLTGAFMGYGHKIKNLTLKGGTGKSTWQSTEIIYTGLIGEISANATVRDIIFENASITKDIGNYNYVGIVAGFVSEGSNVTIDNCILNGKIESNSATMNTYLGGIAGSAGGSINDKTTLSVTNTVSNIAITAAKSNYAGTILGVSQYYTTFNVENCAIIGDISGSAQYAGGVLSWVNSTNGALNLKNTYLGAKIKGSKQYGVCYSRSSFPIESENFYYDTDKNPSPSSWSKFEMLYSGSVSAEGKTTDEIKALKLDGFEVREGEFDNYPVPVWNPTEPPAPPVPSYSCTVKFEGTEDGTVRLFKGDEEIIPENGVYVLSEKGEYKYEVTDLSDYYDVKDQTFTVGDEDNETVKTVWVHLSYKPVALSGTGTEDDPYRITKASELLSLAALVNDGKSSDSFVNLENDVTVKGSWTPLGKNSAYAFKGSFEGNGHSVTVTVDNPNLSYFGFFGCLENAAVRNLTVNGEIYCSEPYAFVGGIAARARGNVTIENCVNNSSVSSLAKGAAGVGGIVGGYDDNVEYKSENIRLTVKSSKNNGLLMVTGSEKEAYVGGIVGSNANCVQLENCENTGDIYAPGCTVGGLLGQAGYQTGDFKPSIKDCSVSGAISGLAGRSNRLWGKGTLTDVTGSGENTAENGEITNELVLESAKYRNIIAAYSEGKLTLIKDGETADKNVTVTALKGEKDISKGYISCDESGISLIKANDTAKVAEETATLKFESENSSLRKPVTINIYPSKSKAISLMDKIAESYSGKWDEWEVFDSAVYEKLGFGKNKTDIENYKNLTVNKLEKSTPLVTDRAKAEIILSVLGINSDKLTAFRKTESYSNAEMLQKMDFGSSYYTAPWILLAEEAGQLRLSDEQRSSLISTITAAQGENGVFYSIWGGEKYDDVDTTGTCLAALARFYDTDETVKTFCDKAINGLSEMQGENGSYGNVNSDAMVITGLAAMGVNPSADPKFTKNGCTLEGALMLYVNNGENGFVPSYYADGEAGVKAAALATEQGFRALITLRQLEKCSSFNIYSLKTSGGDVIEKEVNDFIATGEGKGGEEEKEEETNNPSGGGSTTKTITATLTVDADGETWLTKSIALQKGATAAKLIKEAFSEGGLTADGIDEGYIKSVTKDGKTLAQGDKGSNSGWMYKVDGKSPNVGIGDFELYDGAKVKLYYTRDWTKEEEEESKKWSGSSGSGSSKPADKTDDKKDDINNDTVPVDKTAENTFAFSDIEAGAWYFDSVKSAFEKGLMQGVTETEFAPNALLTRAMFITILYRLEGEPAANAANFTDIPKDAWYEKAVSWGYENKIISGMSETEFAPDENITREQMAAIIARYAEFKGKDISADADLTVYSDFDAISEYAAGALKYTVSNGIIVGKSESTLNPTDTATRAEAAAILTRISE
ncbi:MAG: S-layer homology domain-containing protein [Clostridia bacterium]|nr:S-layer homology domain-containing protein [Clostridia bacterium]